MRFWLAKKLAPEVFKKAEKYDYINNRLDDLHKWCGYEFPILSKAAQWVWRSTKIHFLPIEDYHRLVQAGNYDDAMVGDISQFRAELRRERDASTPSTGA